MILDVLVGLFLTLLRPHHLECPVGWYPAGVRPTGETSCFVPAPSRDDRCHGYGRCDDGDPPLIEIAVRIYCDDDELAIVHEPRGIKCVVARSL